MRVTVVVDAVDVVVTVETCDDAAVADLKAAVACEMDGDPNIALEGGVTKDGQILRDDQSLRANGVAQDDVLRVVPMAQVPDKAAERSGSYGIGKCIEGIGR